MLDQNTVKGDSLNLMKHLCKTAGSMSRDISVSEVFSDKKLTVEATAGEGRCCARDLSSRGRTLKEANVNLSLDYHTQFLKKPFQKAQQYSHLTMQDFKINEVEKTSLNYVSSVLFEYSVQCNVVQSSLSEEAVFLPSFRKRFSISSPRLEHQSHVTYLRIINEPADKKETILKVLSFLYNVYEVNVSINYLLVIGDAKTFELLRKLKDEYG